MARGKGERGLGGSGQRQEMGSTVIASIIKIKKKKEILHINDG